MAKQPNLDASDYYDILGVEKDSSPDVIKKAFRRLAIKYHPDKAKGDKEKATENFKKITEAYEVLSDKEKREKYDQHGKEGFSEGFHFTDPNDLFSKVFGGGGGGDPFMNMFTSAFMDGFGGAPGGQRSNIRFQQGNFDPFGGGGGFPGFSPMMGFSTPGMDINSDGFGDFFMGNMNRPGPRSMPRRSSPKSDPDSYRPKTPVLIKNLRKDAYLNDFQGIVKSYDRSKNRYIVQIDDLGERSLKQENIQQILLQVKIIEMKHRPDLHLKQAIVIDYDQEKERCLVRLTSGMATVSLKMEKILLPERTVVKVVNLTQGIQYNNRLGTIEEVDIVRKRYTILLRGGEKVSIKFSNVRP